MGSKHCNQESCLRLCNRVLVWNWGKKLNSFLEAQKVKILLYILHTGVYGWQYPLS